MAMRFFNIMIIESSPDELKSLKKNLNQFKPMFKIITTSSSLNEAMVKIDKNKPDIIFFDFNVENRSELVLLKKIKELKTFCILSIDHPKDAVVAFEFNVLHTLQRPYTNENISLSFNKIYGKLIKNEVMFNVTKK